MNLRWAHTAQSRPRPLPGLGHSILQQFLHSFHVSDMTTFIIQQNESAHSGTQGLSHSLVSPKRFSHLGVSLRSNSAWSEF